MQNPDLNRRDFHKLTMAAFGGVMTGSVVGCGGNGPPPPAKPATTGPAVAPAKPDSQATAAADTKGDLHVCRGLNACKGQGADGKNACAGQGTCASAATHHDCSGSNACKGQGGCGADPAQNDCKGKGGCHIPLMEHAWKSARKHFEETLKTQSKEYGEAPAAKK